MNVPTIRIDICIYYIVMAVLAVALVYSRIELQSCKNDFSTVQERLTNSAIVTLPPMSPDRGVIPKLKEMEKQNPLD